MDLSGLTIGLVDERGEISATYKGETQNDIGLRTDVLVNVPKDIGMRIMIRTMAPKIVVADEIGKKEDIELYRLDYASFYENMDFSDIQVDSGNGEEETTNEVTNTTVENTTNTITNTTNNNIPNHKSNDEFVISPWNANTNIVGSSLMIPAMIIKLIPFPTPFCVI